jgi:hypothetical protein
MESEKRPEIDIYKALRKNQLITYSSLILSLIISSTALFYSYQFSNNAMSLTINKMLTINKEGEVIPLALSDRNSNIKIEIADHLEKLFERFYSYDFNNVRKQPNKAQWLMAENDYSKVHTKYEGWYKEVEGKKLTQKAVMVIDSIQIDDSKEPYTFKAPAIVTISDGYTENKYSLYTEGKIIKVEPDYPKNPHGFLIIDYKENLQKLVE